VAGDRTKKLINDPDNVIEEMLEGMLAAHPRHLKRAGHPRAIVVPDAPRRGKVGIVIGGGSGHEPTFVGYLGKGLGDACPVGNVFASPPPDPILACAKAVDGGAGVLFLYGNYAGDVMNFDMAAEMAGMDGLAVRTVVTTDDVASAPPDKREQRRGVAGNVFIFKAAGAAADLMMDIDEVERIARHANASTFTMGVALAPCSLPQTRRPNFELGADEMEVGLGIHGEPGVGRAALQTADAVTDQLVDRIFAEMKPKRGERIAVLVNSLGATPLMELYIMMRRVRARLDDAGATLHTSLVGPYCTSLEMAGASVTMMRLDDELARLIDHPADCAMFQSGLTA
jgi:dihydroxyacetone kinase-like protein